MRAFLFVVAAPSHIADDHPLDVIDQQIVQPLRLRPFLEDHMHAWTGVLHERENDLGLSGHGRAQYHLPVLVAHTGHDRCLVYIEREILNCLILHGSRPFLSFGFRRLQTYRKGRAFNMR